MKKPENSSSKNEGLKVISGLLFVRALEYTMMIILLPIIIVSVILVAGVLTGIRDLLYQGMRKDMVDAILPFIGCAVGGIAWLLVGYIGYKIMRSIKRAAHRE